MNVSLIITVLNEGRTIESLLNSIVAQTHPPDEIIVVDGGSTDNTLAILEQYQSKLPLKIVSDPGANISRGRNLAIQTAAGPVIASTDAGVRLAPHWLAALIAPFTKASQADAPVQVVAGFFLPDPQNTFEVAMSATVLPRLADINPETFLPSSRSIAFTKTAWQQAQGYPEWLDYCEDLIFDFNLKDQVGAFAFAPDAIAHFRPRGSLKSFFKQYYQYARGDGKADLWRKRHAIRYATYLVGLPLIILLGFFSHPLWWLAGAVVGGLGLFYTPYKRLPGLWESLSSSQKWQAAAWVPIIRITGDVAKMVGYPVGWRWRLQHLKSDARLKWRSAKSFIHGETQRNTEKNLK